MTSHKIPANSARRLLQEIGWTKPGDITVEEMLNFKGAYIRQTESMGAEGRIVFNGENAIVRINAGITHVGKRNFVLAHELGHLVLHRRTESIFTETEKTLAEWYRNGPHEVEANAFATELLMPRDQFIAKVKRKKLNIDLIADVADYFKTSLTATFLRYANLGDYPVMVVFIEEAVIKWKQASDDFPFQYLPLRNKVPVYTVAGDFFYNGVPLDDAPERVDVIEWFPEDREAERRSSWQIYEQCFQVSKRGIVACLWTF